MRPRHPVGAALGVLLACAVCRAAGGPASAPATAPVEAPTTVPAADLPLTQAERQALRRTPLVRLFESCRGSVVTITATRTERKAPATQPASGPASRPGASDGAPTITRTERGSGFVIHRDGFVLTASHGLRHGGRLEAHFHDGRRYRCREIARDDSRDVALLKIDARGPFQPLPLGTSADLMIGEPAYAIGNPFGFGLSLGQGVVTGLNRTTKTDFALLTGTIQTDAGINPGVSGGPLVNVLGEVIGVGVSRKGDADGVGFAVAIDAIRAAFGEMIAAESRYGFVLGFSTATEGPARVTGVVAGSPAEAAGVREGDVVLAVGKTEVRDAIDFHLALVGRKGGQQLPLRLRRGEQAMEVTVTLGKVEPLAGRKVEGLAPELGLAAYEGRWERLPDFAALEPVRVGTTPAFGLGEWAGRDGFALRLTGYLKAPADGLYLFYLTSDDGSRLYVGDRLVVDHDGLHGAVVRRGLVRMTAGLHSIGVEFFESVGEEALEVKWEGPGFRKEPIPPGALFHEAQKAGGN